MINDIHPDFYLDQIAESRMHKRVVIYPERFEWQDTAEMIWDLFMDDDHYSKGNLAAYLNPQMTHIGVACNCHKSFGQFCVIELGKDVKPLKENEHLHE